MRLDDNPLRNKLEPCSIRLQTWALIIPTAVALVLQSVNVTEHFGDQSIKITAVGSLTWRYASNIRIFKT